LTFDQTQWGDGCAKLFKFGALHLKAGFELGQGTQERYLVVQYSALGARHDKFKDVFAHLK
jgi:hypothetical protein